MPRGRRQSGVEARRAANVKTRRWAARLGAAVVVGAAVMTCLAQPPARRDVPAAEPARPSAGDVLRRLAARCRGGPTCERLNVEVRGEGGKVMRSALLVRMSPTIREGVAHPELLLELGPLRVYAGGGRVSAVHAQNAGTFFTTGVAEPVTAGALGAVLPPLPVPQLDLVSWNGCSDEAAQLPDRMTPYARGIVWQSVEPDGRRGDTVKVSGTCEGGTIVLSVRGDLLQSVEVKLREPETVLRLAISPVMPCDAGQIKLDLAGRTPVRELSELRPRSGLLAPGARVPDMPLTLLSGQQALIKELCAPPEEALPASDAERLVIVMVRASMVGGDGLARGVGRVRLPELAAELRRIRAESFSQDRRGEERLVRATVEIPPMNFVLALVWEAAPDPDVLLTALKDEKGSWGERVVWSAESGTTIDRFAAHGESAAVVLDSGGRLVGTVPIGPGMTTEQLLDQLTLVLVERGQ
ncbi:MAG: hypothetical protein ACK4WH_13025 [Phycisphaerales bacterium]